jgi:RNA polymerase sigma-32 factor
MPKKAMTKKSPRPESTRGKKTRVKKSAPPALTPEIVFDENASSTAPLEPILERMDALKIDEVPDLLAAPELLPATQDTSGKSLATTDPVSRYMAEIRRYPLLTREAEEALAKKYYETHDPRLAETLVTSNLRFVVKIAAEYSKFGAKLIDLIQEGNVGLMHAVKEFNPYRGVRLITYAVWWIRGYIQEYLMRQYSMVRIGTTQNQRKLFYQLQREREELERLGQEGIELLSGRLGIPETEVRDMQRRLTGRDLSLSQPVGDENTATLMDFQSNNNEVPLDDQLAQFELIERMKDEIEGIRKNLNEREIYILDHRLLSEEPITLQEIGDQWGVTREAVRQLEARLVGKIKHAVLDDQDDKDDPPK